VGNFRRPKAHPLAAVRATRDKWQRSGRQRPNDSLHRPVDVLLDGVFPDPDNLPSHLSQFGEVSSITLSVTANFFAPESREAALPLRKAIAVPKIPINKDHHFLFGKYNIRLSG